jgi:hypothetical protein
MVNQKIDKFSMKYKTEEEQLAAVKQGGYLI